MSLISGDQPFDDLNSPQLPVAALLEYAEKAARARNVAEGFIREMTTRVSRDRELDVRGQRRAVKNAIDFYKRKIAGGTIQTDIGDTVDRALASARSLVEVGKSDLARATLRRASEGLSREEFRGERYAAGMAALFERERDIALAAYNADAAAESIIALAEAVHGANRELVIELLSSQADSLFKYGGDQASNAHLAAVVFLLRHLLSLASTSDERGLAQDDLGAALRALGWRERGNARLEEAVAAFRAALEDRTRARAPLDWAATQKNLGATLRTLGEFESGTARLEEAVAAYRAALEEMTQTRAPLDWAMTQCDLGEALLALGSRESGTARFEEAVTAYRAAREEMTQTRTPLDWAMARAGLELAEAHLEYRRTTSGAA